MYKEENENKDETYSTILRALKHPIRRKILNLLSEKEMTFTEIEKILGIDSGHVTYHLTNLGYLISRNEGGQYRLSIFGKAALSLLSNVEGRIISLPQVQLARHGLNVVKPVKVVAIIGIIIMATFGAGFYIQNFHVPMQRPALVQIWNYRIQQSEVINDKIELGRDTHLSYSVMKKNNAPGLLIVETIPSNSTDLDAIGVLVSYPQGIEHSTIGVQREALKIVDNGTYTIQFYAGDAFPSNQKTIQVWVNIDLLEIQTVG